MSRKSKTGSSNSKVRGAGARAAKAKEGRPEPEASLKELLQQYPAERSNLIPLLQVVQEKYGWLSEDRMAAIADYLKVPASVVYGVATFYAQFYLSRQGKNRIKVCQGTACHVRGGKGIMDAVRRRLGINPGQTTSDYNFSLERVACLGSCALAPVMVVNDRVHGLMTTVKADQLLQKLGKPGAGFKSGKKAGKAAA